MEKRVKFADAVPEKVRNIADWTRFFVPEEVPAVVQEIYERGSNGRCMTCGRPVMEEAVVVVNALGMVELYCSRLCNTDMHVKGWLEEQYDDIAEKITFRGASRYPSPTHDDDEDEEKPNA